MSSSRVAHDWVLEEGPKAPWIGRSELHVPFGSSARLDLGAPLDGRVLVFEPLLYRLGTLQVLVATDIAARGIDIVQLPHVVNDELPNVPEDYVHRIGRTGRAGATGEAFSLVARG